MRPAINCTNFTMNTTLVGSQLDENRSNRLDVHTKIYAPELNGYSDVFDKSVDKSRMDLVPKQKFLSYAGGDSDATLRVANQMKRQLAEDPLLARFYCTILHPASRAFEAIERGGILVDMNAFKELEIALLKEARESVMRAKKVLGGRIVAKHYDPSKMGDFNLKKASLICDFMFSPMGLNLKPKMLTPKEKTPSTALEHIEMFEDVPEAKEFVGAYRDFASATHMLDSYVGDESKGFLSHLRSDGRFHPTFFLFAGDKQKDEGGTNTGRTSAKDPAFQTIPQRGKWAQLVRRCYPAPPGYVVVSRDFSQGELRIVACIANEENMIRVYQEGKDLHVATSAPFMGYTYDSLMALEKIDSHKFEEVRYLGKSAKFKEARKP